MNQRIQELADMAEICANNLMASNSTEEQIRERFKQVFAELIVKECVRYFNEEYRRDFDTLWREDLSKGMKEHFGVES